MLTREKTKTGKREENWKNIFYMVIHLFINNRNKYTGKGDYRILRIEKKTNKQTTLSNIGKN